jgi:hypothetical protein
MTRNIIRTILSAILVVLAVGTVFTAAIVAVDAIFG